jgi:ribosome-associated translation inhibitor RaiA
MQVQVNTDNNIVGREALTTWVEGEVRDKLGRFGEHLTRIEVHLGDNTSNKAGVDDKRCMIEARPAGRPPVAVHHQASRLDDAFAGACDKIRRSLDSTLGKLKDHHLDRHSIRGADGELPSE